MGSVLMSLRKLLGLDLAPERRRDGLAAAIHARLAHLPSERIEFVAAFAGLLVRVAHADLEISEAERAALRTLIAEQAGLTVAESAAVAEIVTEHATGLAGIDYAALTETLNAHGTETDKLRLIDCLYAIAAAGSAVTVVEDEEIHAVARALLLSHQQLIEVRTRYKEQLEVIQALRRQRSR
jgi:uncharacterized tellurite resistance protein B-like protein